MKAVGLFVFLVILAFPAGVMGAAKKGDLSPKALKALINKAAELRGTERTCDFKVNEIKRKDLGKVLKEQMDLMTGPLFLAQESVLKSLGLIGKSEETAELVLRHMPDQILGIYLPNRKEFLIVSDPIIPAIMKNFGKGLNMREMVLIHEITHALQDCDMDLSQIGELSDRASAFSAWLEGEATAVGLAGIDPSGAGVKAFSKIPPNQMIKLAQTDPSMEKIPPYLRYLFTFPYLFGANFYIREREANGPLVRVPTSTLELFPAVGKHRWLEPGSPGLGYYSFNLGAITLNYLLENRFDKYLKKIRGEGVWVKLPKSKAVPHSFLWQILLDKPASAKELLKDLKQKLPKALQFIQKDNLLKIQTKEFPMPPVGEGVWKTIEGLPTDDPAVPRMMLKLPKNRWEMVQRDPFQKVLTHNRFPLVLSLTQFSDTPTLKRYPEDIVWKAQLKDTCSSFKNFKPKKDYLSTLCQEKQTKQWIHLHARLASYPQTLVVMVCTGKQQNWQKGFAETCRQAFKSAQSHEGMPPPIKMQAPIPWEPDKN